MLERATEAAEAPPAPVGAVVSARFARDPGEFAVDRPATGTEGGQR